MKGNLISLKDMIMGVFKAVLLSAKNPNYHDPDMSYFFLLRLHSPDSGRRSDCLETKMNKYCFVAYDTDIIIFGLYSQIHSLVNIYKYIHNFWQLYTPEEKY